MKSTPVTPVIGTAHVPPTPTTPQPQPASPQPTSNVARLHARKPSDDEIDLIAMLQTDPDDVEVDLHEMLQSGPPQSVNQVTTTTRVITPSGSAVNPTTSTASSGATTPRATPEKAADKKARGPRLSRLFAGSPARRSSRAADTPPSARNAATPRASTQPTPRVQFSLAQDKVPAFVAARSYSDMMKLCKSTASYEASRSVLQDWIIHWPETAPGKGKDFFGLSRREAQARVQALSLTHLFVDACNRKKPQEAAHCLLNLIDECTRAKTLPEAMLNRLRDRHQHLVNKLSDGASDQAVKQLTYDAAAILGLAIDPLVAPLALMAQHASTGKNDLELLKALDDTQFKNLLSDADWVEKNGEWLEKSLGDHSSDYIGAERKHQLVILRLAQSIQSKALTGDYSLVDLSHLHTAMTQKINVRGVDQPLVNVSGSDLRAVEMALNPMSAEVFRRVSTDVIKSMLELLAQVPGDLV